MSIGYRFHRAAQSSFQLSLPRSSETACRVSRPHRSQWKAAESSYRSASAMNEDKVTRAYAARELERVAVRPVRFSLRSILVKPVRPNGAPWVGRANATLAQAPVPGFGSNRGSDYRSRGAAFAAKVPIDNRPTLFVEITLIPKTFTLELARRKAAVEPVGG